MIFYLIGVSYKSATFEIRQAIYLKRQAIKDFWGRAVKVDAAILITCNRFDISIASECKEDILEYLGFFKAEFPEFYAYSYQKKGEEEILRYGLRLSCGLESQIRGESQILGQLAYWIKQNNFPVSLRIFWSRIVNEAFSIRAACGLNSIEVNVAKLLFKDLIDSGIPTDNLKICVLGTGKVARLIAEYGPGNAHFYFAAHKNRLKAQALADERNAVVISFKELRFVISQMDVLIGAASSPHIILSAKDIPDRLLANRKPLYIYDLGFPYNIGRELSNEKNIVFRTTENLLQRHKDGSGNLQRALEFSGYLIEERLVNNARVKSWNAAQPACYQTVY